MSDGYISSKDLGGPEAKTGIDRIEEERLQDTMRDEIEAEIKESFKASSKKKKKEKVTKKKEETK